MWSILTADEYHEFIGFIKQIESTCVKAAQSMKNMDEFRESSIFIQRRKNTITNALIFLASGVLYPCFKSDKVFSSTDFHEFNRLYKQFKKPFYLLMGSSNSVEIVKTIFPTTQFLDIHYDLMLLPLKKITVPILREDASIHSLTTSDLEKTFPLRLAYELEEVVINPSQYSVKAAKESWHNILTVQSFLGLEIDRQYQALAGSNAQGISCVQIGGVFTAPKYRNRGYSTMLMQKLLLKFKKDFDTAVLFVKKDNASAIHTYKKLGFQKLCSFTLAYRQRRFF